MAEEKDFATWAAEKAELESRRMEREQAKKEAEEAANKEKLFKAQEAFKRWSFDKATHDRVLEVGI